MPPLALRPRRLLLLLAPLLLGCSDGAATGVPLEQDPGGAYAVGSLQLRVRSDVVGVATVGGPSLLRTVVTVTNRGAWPLELETSSCPVRVSGHRTAVHLDAPLFVYPDGGPPLPVVVCPDNLVHVTIPPGASHDLVAIGDAGALRAAGIAGRVFLRAQVQLVLGAAPLVLSAGDVTL